MRRQRPPVRMLTLGDLSVAETLCFAAGWRPPDAWHPSIGRWTTWRSFFDDWLMVRVEFLALFPHRRQPFADRAYRVFVQEGPDATTAALDAGELQAARAVD